MHNMLIGKFCRSPFPHARILKIDTSRAERLPGVKAVVTASDAPKARTGRWVCDRPLLAQGKVRHVGEPVAAVAAVDEYTAEKAVKLIEVEYEQLPVVSDALEAMKTGAPLVHEDIGSYESDPPRPNGSGNILHKVRITTGDAEEALAQADLVHRESYLTRPVHQGFIQPHQVVADISPSGKITLWDSTKAPFLIRKVVADCLGLPMARIRVIAAKVGGEFGGKGTANIEPICAFLALKTGCPVKMSLDFEEELTSTFVRTGAHIDIATGATRDGRLVALKARLVFDVGAYNDGFTHSAASYNLVQGPYSIPNIDIEAFAVYSNNTPTGNCRAPRAPQQAFASESHMDGLARKLGMDPLDFRIRNVVQRGEKLPFGIVGETGIRQTMIAAREYLSRNEGGKKGVNEGWGVASAWWSTHKIGEEGPASSTWVKLNEDGTATLFTGCTEQGGGQHDVLVQIVSETLTIPAESVAVTASDTDTTPYEQGTGGSRTTYRVGNSVILAAKDAKQQLLALASGKLQAAAEDLKLGDGKIFLKTSPNTFVTIAALCAGAVTSGRGPIVGIGEELREQKLAQTSKDKDLVDGLQTGTHVVKVRVDRETGKVEILKYFASHDVGFAFNRTNVEGQIDGGVMFGLGYALTEELRTEHGRTLNANLTDYRVPRAGDAFNIEKSVIEAPSKYGPFGARGIGEPPNIPVAPAISNAIYDAVGVRITDLPLSPGKIVAALEQKGQK